MVEARPPIPSKDRSDGPHLAAVDHDARLGFVVKSARRAMWVGEDDPPTWVVIKDWERW